MFVSKLNDKEKRKKTEKSPEFGLRKKSPLNIFSDQNNFKRRKVSADISAECLEVHDEDVAASVPSESSSFPLLPFYNEPYLIDSEKKHGEHFPQEESFCLNSKNHTNKNVKILKPNFLQDSTESLKTPSPKDVTQVPFVCSENLDKITKMPNMIKSSNDLTKEHSLVQYENFLTDEDATEDAGSHQSTQNSCKQECNFQSPFINLSCNKISMKDEDNKSAEKNFLTSSDSRFFNDDSLANELISSQNLASNISKKSLLSKDSFLDIESSLARQFCKENGCHSSNSSKSNEVSDNAEDIHAFQSSLVANLRSLLLKIESPNKDKILLGNCSFTKVDLSKRKKWYPLKLPEKIEGCSIVNKSCSENNSIKNILIENNMHNGDNLLDDCDKETGEIVSLLSQDLGTKIHPITQENLFKTTNSTQESCLSGGEILLRKRKRRKRSKVHMKENVQPAISENQYFLSYTDENVFLKNESMSDKYVKHQKEDSSFQKELARQSICSEELIPPTPPIRQQPKSELTKQTLTVISEKTAQEVELIKIESSDSKTINKTSIEQMPSYLSQENIELSIDEIKNESLDGKLSARLKNELSDRDFLIKQNNKSPDKLPILLKENSPDNKLPIKIKNVSPDNNLPIKLDKQLSEYKFPIELKNELSFNQLPIKLKHEPSNKNMGIKSKIHQLYENNSLNEIKESSSNKSSNNMSSNNLFVQIVENNSNFPAPTTENFLINEDMFCSDDIDIYTNENKNPYICSSKVKAENDGSLERIYSTNRFLSCSKEVNKNDKEAVNLLGQQLDDIHSPNEVIDQIDFNISERIFQKGALHKSVPNEVGIKEIIDLVTFDKSPTYNEHLNSKTEKKSKNKSELSKENKIEKLKKGSLKKDLMSSIEELLDDSDHAKINERQSHHEKINFSENQSLFEEKKKLSERKRAKRDKQRLKKKKLLKQLKTIFSKIVEASSSSSTSSEEDDISFGRKILNKKPTLVHLGKIYKYMYFFVTV